jgi:hypothetical protein
VARTSKEQQKSATEALSRHSQQIDQKLLLGHNVFNQRAGSSTEGWSQ